VTSGAYDTAYNGVAFSDVFVTCVAADGRSLVWSTFLGGTAGDEADAVYVDGSGVATVAGETSSTNFPATPGAIKSSLTGSSDAFVSRLSANGASLTYSTLLGGSGGDVANGGVVDANGVATVVGTTDSSNFPVTPGAWDSTLGGSSDAFVSRINAAGTALVWSTYLGGSAGDTGEGVALADNGAVVVVGSASSSNFPTTPGAWDTSLDGSSDAFVTKLNANGTGLLFSTYLGGSAGDTPKDVAVNSAFEAFVTGVTSSSNFPTIAGAWDTTYEGSSDVFVTHLNFNGTGLVASTLLGGNGGDVAYNIAIDGLGSPVVAGVMSSTNFPTTAGAYQTQAAGSSDAFVARFDPTLSQLLFASLIGGSQGDVCEAMDADATGLTTIAGTTSSSNYPVTAGAFDASTQGSSESYVSRFDTGGPTPTTYCTAKINSLGCLPAIESSGVPSASAGSGFIVRAVDVLNQKSGLLFYGLNGRSAAPFQGGYLCVATPLRRTAIQNSGGSASGADCSGQFAFDFNSYIASNIDPALVAIALVDAQWWSRDPQSPSTTNLTDALEFLIPP
jgi:hypothetical protein